MKIKKRNLLIMLAVIIVVVAVLELFIAGMLKSSNNQKGLVLDSFYSDECKCLEHNLNGCLAGFKLNGTVCVNEAAKTYTNMIKECSKYECSGINYTYNLNTKNWEAK